MDQKADQFILKTSRLLHELTATVPGRLGPPPSATFWWPCSWSVRKFLQGEQAGPRSQPVISPGTV